MAVDVIFRMPCISSASHWERVMDTFGICRAATNENVDWCNCTRNLKVHAPSNRSISPGGTHFGSIHRDFKCVTRSVGIQAVPQVPRIICTNNWDWSGDTFGVLVAVVDENTYQRTRDSNDCIWIRS